MQKLSIELPKYRLQIGLKLIKRRKPLVAQDPLIPSTKHLKRYRAGNMFSRFFRYIFERNTFKKLLGANIALMIAASTALPTVALESGSNVPTDPIVSAEVTKLSTEKSAQYPVKYVSITQGYRLFHPGIDFDGEKGDPVYPIKPGRVEAVQSSKYAYGNAVLLDHGNQITSLYAHLSVIAVKEGQEVALDTEIGQVGSSGRSTGTHLHLEVRDHGRPFNPYTVLPR